VAELSGMILFRQGRLSVQPVSAEEYAVIVKLADRPAAAPTAKPKTKKKR
jgi:predicted RNA-binding protein with PUA-like domain